MPENSFGENGRTNEEEIDSLISEFKSSKENAEKAETPEGININEEISGDNKADIPNATEKAAEIKEEEKPKKKKHSHSHKKSGFMSEIFEWIESVTFSVVLVVMLFTFLFRIVIVDGPSMENTLHTDDRVIISNFMYKPQIDDIIVFMPKTSQNMESDSLTNKPYVKRIIATEGQTVNIDAENHKVYINGVELNEPYIKELVNYAGNQKFPLTVPQGQVFVMGDNRNNSLDSRTIEVGTVDVRYILGKVVYRVYPINKIGSLYQ